MPTDRRDFLKTGAIAAAATLVTPSLLSAATAIEAHAPRYVLPTADHRSAELAAEALGAAMSAGASYA
ncbi:MAG: twin-arginine translocation signal domain-containing protein, partial [Gemmatimonadaceae bacterium]